MRTLFEELHVRGIRFEENIKAYILLSSLDETWEQLLLSLQHFDDDQLTFNLVSTKLTDCVTNKKLLQKPNHDEQSYLRTTPKNTPRTKRCYTCGKLGHVSLHCRNKKPQQEKEKKNPKTVTTIHQMNKPQESIQKSFYISSKNYKSATCILDSACTNHIVNNDKMFIKKTDKPNVKQVVLAC